MAEWVRGRQAATSLGSQPRLGVRVAWQGPGPPPSESPAPGRGGSGGHWTSGSHGVPCGASCPREPLRASLCLLRFHREDERRRRSQLEAHLAMHGWGPQSPVLSQCEGLDPPLPSQNLGCVPLPQGPAQKSSSESRRQEEPRAVKMERARLSWDEGDCRPLQVCRLFTRYLVILEPSRPERRAQIDKLLDISSHDTVGISDRCSCRKLGEYRRDKNNKVEFYHSGLLTILIFCSPLFPLYVYT